MLALAANVAQICLQVRIDYAEPIVTIQSRLSKLRRFRVLSELILGLPWLVLRIPALMVLAKSILGLDIYSPIQPVWHASVGVGFGLMGIAVWLARHYAGRPA